MAELIVVHDGGISGDSAIEAAQLYDARRYIL